MIEQFPSQTFLDSLAKEWDLSNIVFVRKMENIVFSCDSPSGKVYLRLTTPLRRSKPEIEAEVHFIEHLSKSGIKAPKIIHSKDGNTVVSCDDGNQHFEAVVFAEVSGEHPREEVATRPQFLQTLGALIANMHEAGLRHARGRREEWFEERGLRHALAAADASHEKLLSARLERAVAWMEQLPKDQGNYGLVHADLGALNLFVGEDETIGVIDFDDCCYHFFAFDLAIVIFSMTARFNHTEARPEEATWLSHLIAGYRTVRPLSNEELRRIPLFMTYAMLRLFFWIEYHKNLGTFLEDSLAKVSHIQQWSKQRLENQDDFL